MSEELREAVIDLGAIKSNTQVLRDRSGSAGVMAVVKANAYGHGLVPSAQGCPSRRGRVARAWRSLTKRSN